MLKSISLYLKLAIRPIHVEPKHNEWMADSHPMKFSRHKKAYRLTIPLDPNQRYEFRYLLNGNIYYNDWAADDYISNSYGSFNCVIQTTGAPLPPGV